MRKIRNRLLVAMILLAVACGICVHASAEAMALRTTYQTHSLGSMKPGAVTVSGEPDDGGGRRPNNDPGSDPGVIVVPRGAGGWIIWIVSSQFGRIVGAEW